MGLIARIKELLRVVRDGESFDEFTSDNGSKGPETSQAFGASGMDAHPLPDDAVVEVECSGITCAVAYAQTAHANETEQGEIQVYARSSDGARKVRFHFYADGRAKLWNDAGAFELEAGGDVVINGVRITTAGAVQAPGEGTFNGVAVSVHTHGPGTFVVAEAPGDVAGESAAPS